MKSFFLFFVLLFLIPCLAKAGTVDLSLSQDSIEFSEEILIVGDTVRIYAAVKNVGDVDVSGYVAFFQGSLPIGDSQTISSRVGSTVEEVYVDFVVPSGAFNIRAEIRGTDPEDENQANDTALTQLFTPIFDDDRDGLENDKDNCPAIENFDQIDTDRDGLGDSCDDDDDDDGLTDGVEREIGSSPISSDTDEDGLADSSDSQPTVVWSQPAVETDEVVSPPLSEEPVALVPLLATEETVTEPSVFSDNVGEMSESPATIDSNETTVKNTLTISPKAVFVYQQKDWQTYSFFAQLPSSDGYRVSWDFGDGAVSNKTEIEHVFQRSGDYLVKILVEGPNGQTAEDSVIVHVPFFSLANPAVQFMIAVLFFVFVVLLYFFPRVSRSRPSPPRSGGVKISVRHDHTV